MHTCTKRPKLMADTGVIPFKGSGRTILTLVTVQSALIASYQAGQHAGQEPADYKKPMFESNSSLALAHVLSGSSISSNVLYALLSCVSSHLLKRSDLFWCCCVYCMLRGLALPFALVIFRSLFIIQIAHTTCASMVRAGSHQVHETSSRTKRHDKHVLTSALTGLPHESLS